MKRHQQPPEALRRPTPTPVRQLQNFARLIPVAIRATKSEAHHYRYLLPLPRV